MGHLQPVRLIHMTCRLSFSSPLFQKQLVEVGMAYWAVLVVAARQFWVPRLPGNCLLNVMPVLSMVSPNRKICLAQTLSLEKPGKVCYQSAHMCFSHQVRECAVESSKYAGYRLQEVKSMQDVWSVPKLYSPEAQDHFTNWLYYYIYTYIYNHTLLAILWKRPYIAVQLQEIGRLSSMLGSQRTTDVRLSYNKDSLPLPMTDAVLQLESNCR